MATKRALLEYWSAGVMESWYHPILLLSQKLANSPFLSFRRKPESRNTKEFWTPAFAGVTVGRLFVKPSILQYSNTPSLQY
jgi:hypothetical protein